eukprot:1136466-Pelagomonas_calceolata.AAC.2
MGPRHVEAQCLEHRASSSATVMSWNPGQAQGGRQQGGGPQIESLWPGWRKDALCRWEPLGGSFLNAHGRMARVDLSFLFLCNACCSLEGCGPCAGVSPLIAYHARVGFDFVEMDRVWGVP